MSTSVLVCLHSFLFHSFSYFALSHFHVFKFSIVWNLVLSLAQPIIFNLFILLQLVTVLDTLHLKCDELPFLSHWHTSLKCPDQLWGLPSLLFSGYWGGCYARSKAVNHSPPSNAEVKNDWSYTSTPIIYVHGMGTDNFTFTYTLSFTIPFAILWFK